MTSPTIDRRFGLNGSMAIKVPVLAATTANITLSGEKTIDGVACVTDDRVLVKNQTDASDNGIWNVDTGDWSRAIDFNGARDITNGTMVLVTNGSVAAGTVWKQTTSDPTIGTSNLAFAQGLFSGLSGATFTQSGTGAETRDAEGKMREEITVLDFVDNDTIPHSSILDGTNVINLATIINTALSAASGKTLRFTKGTYKVNSDLTVPTSTDVVFDQGVIIDASAATLTVGLFKSSGTLSSSLGTGLASNVAAGARTLSFNAAPSCSAGDLLIINNPTNGSWNPDRTYYKRGEFLTVKSVSGSTVTLNEATIDAYTTAAGSVVYKVTPTTATIKGPAEIRGNTAGTENVPTIYLDLGRNNKIDGLRLKNTVSTCIELSRCFSPEVTRVDAGKHLTDAGAIQATGVLLNGVQYGWVHHCILHADRHGASMGGSGQGYLVDRFCVIEDCELASTGFAAADFHAAAEFCTYRRCKIDGSINLSGARNTIVDNDVYAQSALTTLINMEVVNSVDMVIEGNRFYRTQNGYVVDANDTTDINANTIDEGVFRFRQNWVYDSVAGDANYLFIRNNGSTASMRLEFTDNHFLKANTSFYGDVLAVSKVTGSAFASLIFEDNEMVNCGIGSCHADDQTIAGNFVTQHSSNTRATTVGVDAGFVYCENNNIKGGGYISIAAIGGGAKAKLISLKGNTIRQNNTVIFPVTLNNAEHIVCAGNTLGNPDITTQTAPIDFANIDLLTIVDDVYLGEGAPAFGSGINGVGASSFTFQRKVSVATPAASFTVFTVPANMSFMPTMVQGRCDTDVTATNGDFWGLGVVGANRLRDYGACSTAAATNKHSKNAKMRFVAAPSDSIQMADAAEVIALTSIATNADGAVAGSNIGGASQTITFRIRGNLIGNLPSVA